jgi:diguanylate cyclase (GGDEF)-like protein
MSIRRKYQEFGIYPLTKIPLGETVEVVRVYSYRLKSIGIQEGTVLEVLHQDISGKRTVVKIGESTLGVDTKLLEHVFVRPLRTSYEFLKSLACYDFLTGLFNRHFAEDILRKEITYPPCCLILADIDDFKRINDNFGHQAGDQVLRDVSSIIKANLRRTDFAIRWGGEEFAAFLRETTVDLGSVVAERIRKAVAEHVIKWKGENIKVTLSLGVCGVPPLRPLELLFELTDMSLYQAKRAGKNRVIVCEEQNLC